ncbi:MAG: cell envelope integrity EipB family protein [Alphaproteobacteria bacterium]|nr:cell envelope integrity EipB family protein [Alphaproteobacteria bacterium]
MSQRLFNPALLLLIPALLLAGILWMNRERLMDRSAAHTAKLHHNLGKTAENFVPHKALYDIRLIATHSGSQVVNISGQMFYQLERSCEGWVSDHRFNMFYEYADTPPVHIASHFSTFEDFAGTQLLFSSQRRQNGDVFEEIRGDAAIKPGQDGQVDYARPEHLSYKLARGTLFPVAHTSAVIQSIQNGETFYKATIFDGSDVEGPVEVNSFIGQETVSPLLSGPHENVDTALLKSQARKVRLAFFPENSEEDTADYEMDLVFHENGIISDMTVEYDDFTISQKLVALEELPDECTARAHSLKAD